MLTGFPHVLKRYGLHADVRVVLDLYRVMELGLVNNLGPFLTRHNTWSVNHAVIMLPSHLLSGTTSLGSTPTIIVLSMLLSETQPHLNTG